MKYNVNVVSFGDNAVDMYVDSNMQYPGGSCVNFSVYAKMFGANSSAYMGYFGSNYNAEQIIAALKDNQIELVKCDQIEGENGYTKCMLKDGDRVFMGCNGGGVRGITPYVLNRFDLAYLKKFDLVHSGIYCFNEDELQKIHKEGIPLSFDFSETSDHDYYEKVAPYVDYAFCSVSQSEEEVKEHLIKIAALGPKLVCATRGSDGCMIYDGQNFYCQPAIPIDQVVDTLGAGDALIASFMTCYLACLKQGTDNRIAIKESMKEAAQFAATICQIHGAFGYGEPIQNKK